jgi:uncharacterized protein involved in outer membrane biogenesis
MKKWLKSLLKTISIFIFIFLIALALILIVLLFYPNQFKDDISTIVMDESGLKLEIKGNINLLLSSSLSSGLRLKVNDVVLSNNKKLIADIKLVDATIDPLSLFLGNPKISSLKIDARELYLSKNKTHRYNFIPLSNKQVDKDKVLVETANIASPALKALMVNKFLIDKIYLDVDRFQYKDVPSSTQLNLEKLTIKLSSITLIENNDWVVDDPRLLVDYAYSGTFLTKQADLIKATKQYTVSKLSFSFEDSFGKFNIKNIAFHLLHKDIKSSQPILAMTTKGELVLDIKYKNIKKIQEPLWSKPDTIKFDKIALTIDNLSLFNTIGQSIEMMKSHFLLKDISIYAQEKLLLNNLVINFLKLSSQQVDYKLTKNKKYKLKNLSLQLKNVPLLDKGKIYDFNSEQFLHQLSMASEINFLSDIFLINQPISQFKLSLLGKNKKIKIKNISLKSLETDISGKGEILFKQTLPEWDLSIHGKNINLETIYNLWYQQEIVSGKASLDVKLTGTSSKTSLFESNSLSGHIKLQSKNITIKNIDINAILENFQSTNTLHLADIGAMAFLGPAGVLVTKSNDYMLLSESVDSQQGSEILHSNFDVVFTQGIAEIQDVAFSSQHYRMAAKGKINLNKYEFAGFQVATVDQNGCAIHKEELKGVIHSPNIKEKTFLIDSLVNSVDSVVSNLTKLVMNRCTKSDTFYTGIVQSPADFKSDSIIKQ